MATRHRLSERLPDYHRAAEACGVVICPGPPDVDCGSTDDRHRRGFYRHDSKPTVHWSIGSLYTDRERVPTRRSLYKFFKLAHRALYPVSMTLPIWRRIYEENMYARRMAAFFRFRLYREILDDDRAKVRFYLRDPQTRKGELEERAWRWAEERD